jgi:hypothetical protein
LVYLGTMLTENLNTTGGNYSSELGRCCRSIENLLENDQVIIKRNYYKVN